MKKSSIWIVIISCIACQLVDQSAGAKQIEVIESPQIRQVIRSAIDAAGGLEAYNSLKKISYQKKSVLYYPDGQIESERIEHHSFQLKPAFAANIRYTQDSAEIIIAYEHGQTFQLRNYRKHKGHDPADAMTVMSAYYVLMMPFKLLDVGTTLSYEGMQLLNNQKVEVIKAEYDPLTHANHSTQDEWRYFFDPSSGEYIASAVYHDPTYALIENTLRSRVDGLYLNRYRKSWRVNDSLEKEFLRGEFWYDKFVLTFE